MTDIIQQDNDTYHFTVSIGDDSESEGLIFANIGLFEYSNEMNKLYLEGSMEYTDTDFKCDKFLESQVPRISYTLEHYPTKRDGATTIQTPDRKISQTFLVNGIEIIEHTNGINKYKFYFTSENYVNLNNNVKITTYSKDNENGVSVTSIIREILVNSGRMEIDAASFENYKSQVKINYISNLNDNLFTSIDYLMNKTVYDSQNIDSSIRGLVYDESNNMIRLYTTADKFEGYGFYNEHKPIVINAFMKQDNISYTSPANIGYMAKKDRVDGMINTKTTSVYSYNMLSNDFKVTDIDSSQILNICNGENNPRPKFTYTVSKRDIKSIAMEWNNNINYYKDIFGVIAESNGLITNQPGVIGACPGWKCGIDIPSTYKSELTEQKTENQFERRKMQSITDIWDIFKVHHYINPQKQCFRQRLVLMRTRKNKV